MQKCLKLPIITRENFAFPRLDPLRACDRREREGDVRRYVENIAFLRIDHPADFQELVRAKVLFCETCSRALRVSGVLHSRRSSSSSLKKRGNSQKSFSII